MTPDVEHIVTTRLVPHIWQRWITGATPIADCGASLVGGNDPAPDAPLCPACVSANDGDVGGLHPVRGHVRRGLFGWILP